MKIVARDLETVFVPYELTIYVRNKREHDVLIEAMELLRSQKEDDSRAGMSVTDIEEMAITVSMVARRVYSQMDCYFHKIPDNEGAENSSGDAG